MAERSVSVKLSARVDAYVAAMNKAKASTEGFSKSSQASLTQVGGQMQRVGGTMTRGLTVPLAAAAVGAVKMSADFDTAFSRMVGLAGVAADEVDDLKESVLDLAGRTAVAPQELADALYQAASSGLDTAAAMKAVEVAAVASASGMGTAGDVVSLVASAVNSYGAANITAAQATDILTATIREGRADPEELAGSLGRVLPVAAAMGVSFQEVGGAVAYLSNIFGDTDRTVTAVNDALAKLSAPTDSAREALAAAGTSADELQSTIRDDGLLAGLELLRTHGFAGNAAAIRELMPDMQGAVALTALLNDESGTLTSTLAGVADNVGASGEAFDAVAEGPGFKLKQSITDMKIALIQAGDVIMPIATGIATGIGDIASAFADLPKPAQNVVLGFLAVVAATGPLLTVGGKIVSNLKLIGAGFDKASASAGGLGVASKGLVGIFAGLTVGFSVFEAINADVGEDLGGLSGLFQDLGGSAQALGGELADLVGYGNHAAENFDNSTRVAKELFATMSSGVFTMEQFTAKLTENNVVGLERSMLIVAFKKQLDAQSEAERNLAGAVGEGTEATEAVASSIVNVTALREGGIVVADLAVQAEEAHVAALEAERVAAEEAEAAQIAHAEAMVEQAQGYVDNAAMAWTWMGDLAGAMDSAGVAISSFSDKALADIDTFQRELEDNILALYGWQNNLILIAAQTSPEFATYLADMGLAGAELVEELAGNAPELQQTFDLWTVASAVAGRDMVTEFAKVSPETLAEFEKLGHQVASTIEGMGALTASEAQAVGAAIAAGIALGVDVNAHYIATAVKSATHLAIARGKEAIEASSPSRLFAREIGAPIAWGIAEGLDENAEKVVEAARRVVEGIEKGIESARKDALNAVDDMVDDVADRFDGIWDAIEGRRDLEGLTESVTDAELDLAAVLADGDATADDVARARERLEEANYRLLRSSQDLLDQGPAGQAAFVALGQAAGLEALEIRNLILAYTDLQTARADAIAQQAAINADAAAAQDVRARFGQAAASGLANDWIDHIAQFANDPAFQLELMSAFLATLPQMATGGWVPGSPGQPVPIVAHGGEFITPANMTAAGNTYGGNSTVMFDLTVNAGMGSDGKEIADVIVGEISTWVRRNGPGAYVKATGG